MDAGEYRIIPRTCLGPSISGPGLDASEVTDLQRVDALVQYHDATHPSVPTR